MRSGLSLLRAFGLMGAFAAACRGGGWSTPAISLPEKAAHPLIACTPAELARLREAWQGKGPARDAVATVVDRADKALAQPVDFPPRGGQHNQWYQCTACQLALVTLDATHHQCPRCKKIYSGEPYDDVLFGHKHDRNLAGAAAAAWAYALTGDEKYAAYARTILLGYADRYLKYPYHTAGRQTDPSKSASGGHLHEQTLNEACDVANYIAPAFDLIHDSKSLSDADRAAIRDGLLLPMLRNIDRNKAGKSNWQTWHNAAMLLGGAVLGDAAWVRKAIEAPGNGFVSQMATSVTEDGMWYENSWGYHFYTLSAMVKIVEGARRLGIDLWSHPALRKMFTLAPDYAMADGSLPRFGDDVQTRVSTASAYLEFAWHAYKDPAMQPWLPGRATWDSVLLGREVASQGEPPPRASKVCPGAGHAILRTKGQAGLTAAFTFGPYGGFHGHYDKLSFVLFGYGRELGVDPGRAKSQAYRLPIHTHWYKATLGHNAVLVDQAPQKPAAGDLELFAASETCAAAAATCDAAYPGVRHRRLLCLMPGYLLVFDELTADAERRFDWVYHSRGRAVRCDAAAKADTLGDRYAGQEYVQNVKSGLIAEAIRARFEDDPVATCLAVDAAPGTEVRIGDGPGGSVLERIPMVMVTRRGKAARFAAVLEPVSGGGPPAVTDVALDQAEGRTTITVRRGDTADVVTLTPGKGISISSGGKTLLTSP